MSNAQVNRLQTAIDAKAKNLAKKDEDAFMKLLRNSFSVSMDCHIHHKIKDSLPEGFTEDHVKSVINAMRQSVYESAFNRHQDCELNNIKAMLDFMNQYDSGNFESE